MKRKVLEKQFQVFSASTMLKGGRVGIIRFNFKAAANYQPAM